MKPPTTNSNRAPDGLKYCPCITHAIKCYMFSKGKKNQEIKKKIKFFLLISNLPWTSKISFQRFSFHTWISTKSFIGFGLCPSTIACKKKLLLVKHFHIRQQFFFKKSILQNKILPSVLYTKQMECIDQCVW